MKSLIITLLNIIAIIPVKAQIISEAISLKSGEIVDSSHLFKDGDDCTFITENGTPVDWILYLKLLDDKGYSGPYLVLENQSAFHIRLYEDIFSKIGDSAPIRQHCIFPDEFDDRAYFVGEIIASKDGDILDRVNITFDVLPRVPKVLSAEINGEYDFEWSTYDYGAQLSATVLAPGSTALEVIFTYKDYYWECPPGMYFMGPYDIVLDSVVDEVHDVCEDGYVNICQYWAFYGKNRYGRSAGRGFFLKGDTIALNDYVTDPAILADIESLKLIMAGVESVPGDNKCGTIFITGDELHYTGDWSQVVCAKVIDLFGRELLVEDSCEPIDVSALPKGVYIAIYETKKQVNKFKFILR